MLTKELQPGDSFEHYRIEALTVRTTMTTVYRATDLRTGQLVAIKIPHMELECDPVFFSRFQREAAIGRKLRHPGIARTMEDEDLNHVCIIMEWVDGNLLRDILAAEGTLPAERAVRIVIGVCEALTYIHSQGVIHRDLKPENIMVGRHDRIKLIDFGISASAGARRLTFSKLSNVIGTPDYISPEQIRTRRADGRSDIYALGVILYEMLTGHMPFEGPNPFAVMNDRLVNQPVPPREVNPEISAEMQEIIYRALERDPDLRYASAHAFAEDLKHPENVTVTDPSQRRAAKAEPTPFTKRFWSYAILAMIPLVIVMLLLLAAHTR